MSIGRSAKARAEGVRVMSGIEGSTRFSRSEAFDELSRKWELLSLVRAAKKLNRNMPHRFHSLENLVLVQGMDRHIPAMLARPWYLLSRGPRKFWSSRDRQKTEGPYRQVINKRFLDDYDHLKDQDRVHGGKAAPESVAEDHWNKITAGIFARSLEFSEIALQSFSIEGRYPFSTDDCRILLAIPAEERI